jgi:carbonic anhydrase
MSGMTHSSRIANFATYTFAALVLTAQTAAAQHDPHWSYEGKDGPAQWGTLSPEFASCSSGQHQSPIDIPATTELSSDTISFAYAPGALDIVNNGHTVQVNYGSGSSVGIRGKRYNLLQFHFHSPSEHRVAGRHEEMEMHFVHRDAEGKLAVIAVLIREGAKNSAYEPVLRNLPQSAGKPISIASVSLDSERLLPASRAYWSYAGSLTTPPCTEGVTWIVLKDAVELSRAQIDAFTAIHHNNARPLQPPVSKPVDENRRPLSR